MHGSTCSFWANLTPFSLRSTDRRLTHRARVRRSSFVLGCAAVFAVAVPALVVVERRATNPVGLPRSLLPRVWTYRDRSLEKY
jgi:hypothetical protein